MRHARLLSLLVLPLLVGGCSTLDDLIPSSDSLPSLPSIPEIGLGSSAPVETAVTGFVVSDEPLAAKVGADILAQGGSAADAATGMFFALTATYPVAAGLGGGGVCLVRDAGGRAHEFDFLPRAAARGGAYAVPGAVAGFVSLQKVFGTLPWQRDVAPGETYAATGFPISHVLSLRLAQAQNVVRLDAALAAEFLDESGQPKAEGAVVANKALSLTLSDVRLSQTDGFYAGRVGAALAAYAGSQGGTITSGDLAGYRSTEGDARSVTLGARTAVIPGPGTGAGAFAGSLVGNLSLAGDSEAATVAALRKTLAGFNIQDVPSDLGATGFAALDSSGQAVACGVTMNGPFGSGHTAGDTGVTLAAAPSAPAGIAAAFLTPMIASNGGAVALAGAGTGGPNGSGAMAYALLKMAAGQPLARPGDMRSTGLAPAATVNLIACQESVCVALPDPGGHGLGAGAQTPAAATPQ